MGVLDTVASPLDDVASTHVFRAKPVDGDYPCGMNNGADTNASPHHAGVESHQEGEAHGRRFYRAHEVANGVA